MTPNDAHRLALAFPEARDASGDGRWAVEVAGKAFAWTYLERPASGAPRVMRPEVIAVRCRGDMKPVLLEAMPNALFDDDHYRSFPAVLVRLDEVSENELRGLLEGGWRCQAPKALIRAFEAARTAQ